MQVKLYTYVSVSYTIESIYRAPLTEIVKKMLAEAIPYKEINEIVDKYGAGMHIIVCSAPEEHYYQGLNTIRQKVCCTMETKDELINDLEEFNKYANERQFAVAVGK